MRPGHGLPGTARTRSGMSEHVRLVGPSGGTSHKELSDANTSLEKSKYDGEAYVSRATVLWKDASGYVKSQGGFDEALKNMNPGNAARWRQVKENLKQAQNDYNQAYVSGAAGFDKATTQGKTVNISRAISRIDQALRRIGQLPLQVYQPGGFFGRRAGSGPPAGTPKVIWAK